MTKIDLILKRLDIGKQTDEEFDATMDILLEDNVVEEDEVQLQYFLRDFRSDEDQERIEREAEYIITQEVNE